MLSQIIRGSAPQSWSGVKQLGKIGLGMASSSTIDEPEINKFNKHGKQWWDESSEVKILLSMNEIRVPFIRDGLINSGWVVPTAVDTDKPLTALKILDVGCGGGYLSESLARLGAETTGVDGSKELIDAAVVHRNQDDEIKNNLKYEHTSIEQFSIANGNAFDAVVSSEVIEHVTNKNEFVKHCVACLKPGGSIFMTTISQTIWANVFGIFAAENILRIVPKGAHEFDKLITPHHLQRLFEENNCYTKRIHGFTYNPLTGNWCWVPFTEINYAIHAVKAKST